MELDKSSLEVQGVLVKEDESDFTNEEMEGIFDSFIEWVESHKLFLGGSIYFSPTQETETTSASTD